MSVEPHRPAGYGPVSASVLAGVAYALAVFGVGFGLGAIRILVLTPLLGSAIAVLLEAPFILGASWWLSLKCTSQFHVMALASVRVLMGTVALATLMLTEIGLSVTTFHRPPSEYLQSLMSLPGAIGLGGQLAFASIPLLQAYLGLHRKHTGRH